MRYLAALSLIALLAAGPAHAAAQCDAPDRQLYGLNIAAPGPSVVPSVSELRALGVRWVRIEYIHSFGFEPYDRAIDQLHAGGVRVMLLVDYMSLPDPKPASSTPVSGWSGYRAAFTSAVRTIAAHFGDRVDAWEVWNEPDLFFPSGYDPGVPTAVYGPMLSDAAAAIRASSGGTLVVGGLASGDVGYLRDTIAAAGGTLAYDAIGVHPYGQRAPRGWPDTGWGFGDLADFYDRYYAVAGRPLWVTEAGTEDVARQGEYVRNFYTLTRDAYLTRVPVVFWFAWSDSMVPPFGLTDAGGGHKPSYDAYAALAPDFDPGCGATVSPTDADGDGSPLPYDCDDSRASVRPGAAEVCGDGVDQDCDGADAACVPSGEGTITFEPRAPREGDTVIVDASHVEGLTNIDLRVRGPSGRVSTTGLGVVHEGGRFHWRASFVAVEAGEHTATLRADPAGAIHASAAVHVAPAPLDAGGGRHEDGGHLADAGAPPDLTPRRDAGPRTGILRGSCAAAPHAGGSPWIAVLLVLACVWRGSRRREA